MDPTTAIIHLTREKLLRNVVQSGLVNEPDVNRFAAQHADLDMLALGQRFVSAGMLTNYQLELICQGLVAELKVGNYEILDRLGGGGMGTVYKARHRRMKRIVALKVLLSKYCRDEAFVARFQREVETIAKLGHPNIVMAYDADESEAGHFLVMEFVEGRDLASLVQKKGPLDVATAIDFVRQTALGLAYAHSMNVIHRDIKPANLLCDKYRTVKITDLGLARISAETDQSTEGTGITQIGFALGTPDFMPPEQALDPQSLDHRADIYSLGATLFFLLTGRVMYPGPSVMAVLLQHRDSPLPSIVDFRPDVPHELDAAFHKMVHKHPHDRFASMAEVVGALDAIPGIHLASDGHVVFATPAAADAPRQSSTPGIAPSIRVLFVERSRVQLAIFRRYLEAQGITHTTAAANGAQAFEIAAADLPDAVVCSLSLEDMSGVDLIRKVRGIAGDRPPGGVLLSSETDSRDEAAHSGLDHLTVLLKPFTPDELVGAINQVTGQSIEVRVSDSSVIGIPIHKSTPREKPHRSAAKVLIVDDSSTSRLHERLVLQQLGFSHFVDVADAQAGIDAAKSNPFDLIVTDYNMPLMNGDAMISLLRKMPATASVPIVMVTTETDPAKLNPVRALGVEAIFGKAFRPEEVAPLIDRLFVG